MLLLRPPLQTTVSCSAAHSVAYRFWLNIFCETIFPIIIYFQENDHINVMYQIVAALLFNSQIYNNISEIMNRSLRGWKTDHFIVTFVERGLPQSHHFARITARYVKQYLKQFIGNFFISITSLAYLSCWRAKSQLLPYLPKSLLGWRGSHGTHEICSQGSKCFRCPR